ncbi:MFS transporter [uncultured Parasphingorhabdus sp.]|uniref:MFS transporter n=1 Tax=uncultured Parasphingorhabdus sp. TaxID=2709694 RepID=UPI002AA8353C|nr:MFS transporter [uncultured Parasphingorhabdus sp.]
MSSSEFSRGWKPLFSGVIGVATGASPIPFNVLPIVLGPIHLAMGWSFVQISIGITIYGIIGAFLAPAVGALADKYGVKPVATASLTGFGIAFSLLYFTPDNIFGFYAIWALIGILGIGSTPVTWSRTINMWFYRNRGLALGILLLGTSIAGLIVPQIANRVLEAFDWRMVFPVLALLPLLIGLPLALALFRDPQPEERPAEIRSQDGNLTGIGLGQAIRGYRFWILFLSVVLIALAYGGAHIHMVQMVQMHGLTAGEAAIVMSIVASGIFAGRIIVGLLFDKFWAPGVAFPVLVMPVIACWLLIGTDTSQALIFGAAFLLGFAAGAESDVISYLASRYFGMVAYGRIYGFLYLPFGVFSSVSPVLYGLTRDTTGNYDLMLMVAMGLFALGGLLLLTLGRYPDWAVQKES